MIKTIIVDDEPDSIRVLQRLLAICCPRVSIEGAADGVETGFQLIQSTQPDLVFLDIEMIKGNAFDLLQRLQPLRFQVIFVTAFDNYAIRAFKYSAVDYLLKPVAIDDLREAVERAKVLIEEKSMADNVKILLENLLTPNQKMAVPTLSGLVFVPVRNIIRFEAKGSYTSIYLDKGEPVLATRNIKEYEDLLPESLFCRIHNSHIINLQQIQTYNKGRGGFVTMEDGSSIEVASRRRDEFLRRLMK